jgi:hypothetical protein
MATREETAVAVFATSGAGSLAPAHPPEAMATSNPASVRTRGAAAAKGVPLTRARTSPSAPRRRPQEPVASRGRHRLRNSLGDTSVGSLGPSVKPGRHGLLSARGRGSVLHPFLVAVPPTLRRTRRVNNSYAIAAEKAESFGVRPPDELAICNKSDPGPGLKPRRDRAADVRDVRGRRPELQRRARPLRDAEVQRDGALGDAQPRLASRTSMTAVAEHAGVRRSTLYRRGGALRGVLPPLARPQPTPGHRRVGRHRGPRRPSACALEAT